MLENKQVLFNLEAEQAVLGCCLVDKETVFASMEGLQVDDFYRENHKIIFQAISNLFNINQPIDIITLKEELIAMKKLENIGNLEYLSYLTDSMPIIANAEKYITIIKKKAIKRNLIKIANEIIDYGNDASIQTEELLELAEKKIFDISNGTIKKTY